MRICQFPNPIGNPCGFLAIASVGIPSFPHASYIDICPVHLVPLRALFPHQAFHVIPIVTLSADTPPREAPRSRSRFRSTRSWGHIFHPLPTSDTNWFRVDDPFLVGTDSSPEDIPNET